MAGKRYSERKQIYIVGGRGGGNKRTTQGGRARGRGGGKKQKEERIIVIRMKKPSHYDNEEWVCVFEGLECIRLHKQLPGETQMMPEYV